MISPTAEAILKALEKVFLSPRIATTVFFACLIALLEGPHFAVLAPLVQQHAAWLWFFLLVSGFYSISFPAQWAWNTTVQALDNRRARQREITRLESLTMDEKHILQEHVENGEQVVSWSRRKVRAQEQRRTSSGLSEQIGHLLADLWSEPCKFRATPTSSRVDGAP